MAADQQVNILNNYKGSLTESADLKLEEVEKNIRVLITKLKGSHMNEGKSLICLFVYLSPINAHLNMNAEL